MATSQLTEILEATNNNDRQEQVRNLSDHWIHPKSFTWACPDHSFVKKILQVGSGLDKPKEGSRCRVCIEVEPTSNFDSRKHFPIGINQSAELILGESDTWFAEVIDKCVETMLLGEQCEVLLAPGLVEAGTDLADGLKFTVKLEELTLRKDSWEMTFEEKWQAAMHHKTKGTEHFKNGNLFGATRRYAKSLRLLVSVKYEVPPEKGEEYNKVRCTLYSNLAACQLKQNQYRNVIQNCSKALEIEPNSVKCLYRRGQAYASINEVDKAKGDLKRVLKLEPGNTAAVQQLRIVTKQIRAQNEKLGKAMSKLFS
ncbi:FK506-binding protein-like [Pristis pectinata]|uniref:FK506-binding protein-like n=1 Tax=Pristis pectinata TaxID=685728 RepID=UPI00223CC019|nr:FK506-binding protein-like [Pristis pectinata]